MLMYWFKCCSWFFCTASDTKSTEGGEHYYTEWLQNEQKENRFILCVYIGKVQKVEVLIHRMIMKQEVKTNMFCVLCKND